MLRSTDRPLAQFDDSRSKVKPTFPTPPAAHRRGAIRTLRLGARAGGWTLVKLEVLGEAKTLYPDMIETVRATERLAKEGFEVMVYCTDDPIMARRCEEAGAVAVMPLGAPIGSGLGVQNPVTIRLIVEGAKVPVLLTPGRHRERCGPAADGAWLRRMLMNPPSPRPQDPILMARAMKAAVESGRRPIARAYAEAPLRRSV